jgi:predicted RNase H-like HicB family nuclease
MELKYTYWQEKDGWFLGYLDDCPDHWTQGKTLKELEEMLADLYEIQQEENPEPLPQRKTGTLIIKSTTST